MNEYEQTIYAIVSIAMIVISLVCFIYMALTSEGWKK